MGLIHSMRGLVKLSSFNILKDSASIILGTTYQIPYVISPNNSSNKKIYWSSSDTSIATVDGNGIVTAVAVGTCTITGTTDYLGLTDTISMEITVVHPTGVTLNTNSITLEAGQTSQLIATVSPNDATNKNVTWSSSNTSVATVSSTGLVTYVSDGTSTITVTTVDGNKTATCSVVCEDTPVLFLEYIESTGAQVIKTGVYANKTGIRANVDFQITSSSVSDQAIIGFYNNENSGYSYRCGYGPNNGFTMSSGASSLDRQTATGSSISFTASSYQIYLFAKQRYTNGNYDSNAYARLYSCQIYDNNTLIRDLVPCINKQGVIGMWDKVNKVFYSNQGSGTFTAGPEAPTLQQVKQVEYIQSSGNGTNNGQFIKPGVSIEAGTKLKIEIDFQRLNQTTEERDIFAQYTGGNNRFQLGFIGGGFQAKLNSDTNGTLSTTWSPNTYAYNTRYLAVAEGTSSVASSRPPFLFAQNEGDTYGRWCCSAKLYYCKIRKNNTLVRDFIPCYTKIKGTIGLFDKINNKFYVNQGSGAFTKGPDV